MASIPLPALSVHAPQVDAADTIGRAISLQDLMQRRKLIPGQLQQQQQQIEATGQENEVRAQQIKDSQVMAKVLADWDPASDTNGRGLAQSFVRAGGSGQGAMAIQQKMLDRQKTLSDLAKNDAETGAKNLETKKGQNDIIAGKINATSSLPDEQLAQGITQLAQELDPQHAQAAQQIAQSGDPAKMRQGLTILQKGYMGETAQIEQALKAAQTRSANANALKDESQAAFAKASGLPVGVPVEQVEMADWLKKNPGKTPSDFMKYQKTIVPAFNFNLQNAGATGQGGQPSAMAKAIADGSMKWTEAVSARTPMNVKQALLAEVKQIKPDFNSGDAAIERDLKKSAIAGPIGDKLNAINTAREHMKVFTDLGEKLNNGDIRTFNKIGNAIGVEFGSDNVTNFNIAKQFFAGEVGKAVVQGEGTKEERSQLADDINNASSWKQLQGALTTADRLLAGKQATLHNRIEKGAKGQVDYGGETTPTTPPAAPAPSIGAVTKK
jgi:hypothetical protein